MKKIENLIQELCPNGVENKLLGEVVSFINGRAYKQTELLDSGKYKVLRVGNFYTNDKWYYSDLELDRDKYCDNGDLIYTWAATLGAQIWNGEKAIFHYHIWKLKFDEKIINKRYLYHFLQNDVKRISNSLTNSTMPHVSMASMVKRVIPVPPLPVQAEIVRILDNFTVLTAELNEKLTTELTARKKQYEYYLDNLFALGNKVDYKMLGEIAEIYRGGNFQKKDFSAKGFPAIHYGQIYTKYGSHAKDVITYIDDEVAQKSRKAHPNDIVMAITSENIDDVCKCVAWVGDEEIAVSGHIAVIHHNQNAKYLSYYFHTTDFYKQKVKLAHGTKVIEVKPDDLKKIKIPVPPLEEQERIVSILDRFDKLCNDISGVLPAEITARQKQYEYYRDKLLTFNLQE